jgi:hypothetical protein
MWSGSSSRSDTSGGAAAAAAASRSGAGLSQGKLLEAAAAAAAKSGESSAAAASVAVGASSGGGLPAELPPVGCAPDAYKLFVGNIPKSYTEEELRPVSCSCVMPLDIRACCCAPRHVVVLNRHTRALPCACWVCAGRVPAVCGQQLEKLHRRGTAAGELWFV